MNIASRKRGWAWLTATAFSILLLVFLTACDDASTAVAPPVVYDKDGLHFMHPENWEVTEDSTDGDVRTLFIEPPGHAIIILKVMPYDTDFGLLKHAQDFAQLAMQSVPVGKMKPSQFGAVSPQGDYNLLEERFVMTLIGVQVPHTRLYWQRAWAQRNLVMALQVSDEDLGAVQAAFEALVKSLTLK